jgi:hypothetical protein
VVRRALEADSNPTDAILRSESQRLSELPPRRAASGIDIRAELAIGRDPRAATLYPVDRCRSHEAAMRFGGDAPG